MGPAISSGTPVPVSVIFPDEPAGNAGLCRLIAFEEVRLLVAHTHLAPCMQKALRQSSLSSPCV